MSEDLSEFESDVSDVINWTRVHGAAKLVWSGWSHLYFDYVVWPLIEAEKEKMLDHNRKGGVKVRFHKDGHVSAQYSLGLPDGNVTYYQDDLREHPELTEVDQTGILET